MKNICLLFIAFLFIQFNTFAQISEFKLLPGDGVAKDRFETSETDIFKDKDSRTIVNKTILDNGFLIVEKLEQFWIGSNWLNDKKYTYTYDGNSNMIEELWQDWDGSNWMNSAKGTYIYDVNNNWIEQLWQGWDGSNWVNYRKYIYTYIISGIEQLTDGIKEYSLSNNYPNPFNPSTTISYSVPEIEFVTLKVYDVLGNEIETLVNEEKPLGSYEVEFNAITLPSGIYFYRLQAGSGRSFVETKKMVLMK